jgi:ferric-dicitrate binding protein FerR (iron transport regulator)
LVESIELHTNGAVGVDVDEEVRGLDLVAGHVCVFTTLHREKFEIFFVGCSALQQDTQHTYADQG